MPAGFHSMLPMYRVKFLYAEVLSALSTVMPPVAAMRAVQVFSVLLFGASCCCGCARPARWRWRRFWRPC